MSGFNLTLDPEPVRVRRLEVLTGVVGRRRWSAEDKARIVEETFAPGASVSDVARRHDIRPQQLFGWRREMRLPEPEPQMTFVPALVEGPEKAERAQSRSGYRVDRSVLSGAILAEVGVLDNAEVYDAASVPPCLAVVRAATSRGLLQVRLISPPLGKIRGVSNGPQA